MFNGTFRTLTITLITIFTSINHILISYPGNFPKPIKINLNAEHII